MTTENEHLRHIKEELSEIEDAVDELKDKEAFHISQRISQLRSYVNKLSIVVPTGPVGLVKLCIDCGEEEANPGLDRCGECYHRCITGG